MNPTHYETLGVHETAPPEVIEAAWKALMKKFHPDSQTPNLELTQKINAAHDVLADEEKRKAYDAQLKAQKESGRFQHAGFQHPWMGGHMNEQGAYPNAYPNAYPQPRSVALENVIQDAAQTLAHAAFESLIDQMPPAVQHGIRNAMRFGRRRAS